MRNEQKNTIVVLSKSGYAAIITSIIIATALTILLLVLSQNKETTSLTVSEKSRTDYKVCVKENDYYEEECLDKGMLYIANLIDYINVDFNYELTSDKEVDYDYTYYVEAEVNVFAKNDPTNIMYTDTKRILEEKTKKVDNTSLLQIKENVKIKYDEYNSLIRDFKTEYGVNADSNIKIKLYVKPNIEYSQFENLVAKDEVMMELIIPLTEKQINIKAETKDLDNTKSYSDKKMAAINYVFLGSGTITLLLGLVATTVLISSLTKKERNKSPYRKEVDKILREYDDIITETDTIIDPDETEYSYVDCKSFNELKNMALNIKAQIIYSELKELHRKQRTWFYIVDDSNKKIYRYAVIAE